MGILPSSPLMGNGNDVHTPTTPQCSTWASRVAIMRWTESCCPKLRRSFMRVRWRRSTAWCSKSRFRCTPAIGTSLGHAFPDHPLIAAPVARHPSPPTTKLYSTLRGRNDGRAWISRLCLFKTDWEENMSRKISKKNTYWLANPAFNHIPTWCRCRCRCLSSGPYLLGIERKSFHD